MNRRLLLSFALIAILAAAGCSRGPAPAAAGEEAALRTALEKYLTERTGLNLPAMDITFHEVRRAGEAAEADVEFVTRDGQGAMRMTYVFAREDGAWVVTGAKASGMSTDHPVPGAAGAPIPDSGTLPPGHPPLAQPEKAQPPRQP
jgi:hypothetical protein